MNFTILRYEEIGSTNDEALRQAKIGAKEGLCIIARGQTAGRGRQGRPWISERDAGLFFSVVLRPRIDKKFLPLITLIAGVAVHDTLEELFAIDCDLKWVNDVLVNDKKICGILTETCETQKGLAVILGIGINLKSAGIPAELGETATSLEAETGLAPDFELLLRTLTQNLERNYLMLNEKNGADLVRDAWSKRSTYAFGCRVRVSFAEESIAGITRGLEPDGALRIETEGGEIRVVRAGEVARLRAIS
jgi:BirA family biotin operon repressor/biotin-[acetyl-CoA-carboxylase] ligase